MLPPITSRQNPLCKLVRSLHTTKGRRENGLFLAEGRNAVEAALAAGWPIRKLMCPPEDVLLWAARGGGETVQPVTEPILSYLCDAQTSAGVLALCAQPQPHSFPNDQAMTLVLDGIGDPGNIGTLIRAADAAGCGGVLCTSSSCDPFGPKAVRASAGSIFHVPLVIMEDHSPRAVAEALRRNGTPIITTAASAPQSCFEFDWPPHCALVLGHETRGVSKVFEEAATAVVSIPIFGKAESLNVAMAGTVLAYAWKQSTIDAVQEADESKA
jgi:TrmH family RNA methyltransferase